MNPARFLLALLACLLSRGPSLAVLEDARGPAGPLSKPLPAEWTYSRDGGKTFTATPPAGAPPKMREGIIPLAFRGTFQIADPAKVAGLWVRIAEPGDSPRAAICDGDLVAAAGGYWKDLGFCPTLLNARATLNGQRVKSTRGPMLQFWLPLEGDIRKGANTIELAGDCYTYWGSQAAPAITAQLVVAEPQAAPIINGPLLGDFGDGHFTLACRTLLPAELIVEATPTTPQGKPITITSSRKIWHRVKVPVPPGTRSVSYRLRSRVGEHESSRGPFTLRFPEKEFRFVSLGNVKAHRYGAATWGAISQRVQKLEPAFVLHTGNCSEHGTWEFDWENRYFEPAGKMLASIPTLLTPGWRDFAGAVQELHYTPAADTYSHNWSKAVGSVRVIGLDGNQTWKTDSPNTLWLEKELTAAKERFVFVLEGYPGYSSGKHSNKLHSAIVQTREVILPLLSKHKVQALISGQDPCYERCEPTPDKGCTQIVTGTAGKDAYPFSGTASRLNPFGQGKGRDWAGLAAHGAHSFCVFEVKADRVELRAVALPAEATGELRVVDTKTFLPRN